VSGGWEKSVGNRMVNMRIPVKGEQKGPPGKRPESVRYGYKYKVFWRFALNSLVNIG
jgi:hypothetical protein